MSSYLQNVAQLAEHIVLDLLLLLDEQRDSVGIDLQHPLNGSTTSSLVRLVPLAVVWVGR